MAVTLSVPPPRDPVGPEERDSYMNALWTRIYHQRMACTMEDGRAWYINAEYPNGDWTSVKIVVYPLGNMCDGFRKLFRRDDFRLPPRPPRPPLTLLPAAQLLPQPDPPPDLPPDPPPDLPPDPSAPVATAAPNPSPILVPSSSTPVISASATYPDVPSIVIRNNELPVASSSPPHLVSPADPNRPNCHQPTPAPQPPTSPPPHLPPELLPFDTPPRRHLPNHHHEPPLLPFSAAPPDPPPAAPPDPPDLPPCRPPHQPDDCVQRRPSCTQGVTHVMYNSNNTLCRVNPGTCANGSRIVKSVVDASTGSRCTTAGDCWFGCSSLLTLQAHTHIAPHA